MNHTTMINNDKKLNNAFVTVLSTDEYLPGVIALKKMLNMVSSKFPLICAVSKGVSYKSIKWLSENNIEYITIKKSIWKGSLSQQNYNHWSNTFDKLTIWELEEYEKLVYLDADLMVLTNLDHLFEMEPFSGVCAGKNTPGCENYKGINSGLIVLKPNKEIAFQLYALVDEVIKKKQSKNLPVGDQDVIQEFLGDKWNYNDSLQLDDTYNIFVSDLDYYIKQGYSLSNTKKTPLQIKVVHFIGKFKPWMWASLSFKDKLRVIKRLMLSPGYLKAFRMYQIYSNLC